jgi:hypothetical protein
LVSYAKFIGYGGETRIGRPHLHSSYNGRREEVNVHPSDATPIEVASANELDDVTMRNDRCLMHPFIVGQKLLAASPVADEEFSIDEFMTGDLVEKHESTQLGYERRPVG